MGVAQHHDAVSGTSKQHVANDYAKRLYHGESWLLKFRISPSGLDSLFSDTKLKFAASFRGISLQVFAFFLLR